MTSRERAKFARYLLTLTDEQVQGVIYRETKDGQEDYAQLARDELDRRKIE